VKQSGSVVAAGTHTNEVGAAGERSAERGRVSGYDRLHGLLECLDLGTRPGECLDVVSESWPTRESVGSCKEKLRLAQLAARLRQVIPSEGENVLSLPARFSAVGSGCIDLDAEDALNPSGDPCLKGRFPGTA
jgi:hypothetical protein